MLIRIVSQYLESHKRLVIPQLGTFIVKEPGRSIVFSELLKRDDGVLRSLLVVQGVSELEAAGEVDRFVFEVRHATEHGREFRLEGFGVLKPGPNGTIAFAYEPQPDPQSAPQPAAANAAQSGPEAARPQTTGADVRPGSGPAAEPRVTPSAKLNPEPYVKGLRYGKPRKGTDAYTYVDRAPGRRMDRFLWIAIIAVLIAVGAIAYGYYHEASEREQMPYVEQPAPVAAAGSAQTEQTATK